MVRAIKVLTTIKVRQFAREAMLALPVTAAAAAAALPLQHNYCQE
jgi:hypothetical protein